MKRVNSIAIDSGKFDTKQEFNDCLGRTISNLLELGQTIVIRYEDCGIYLVEFEADEPGWGGYMPYWLTDDEFLSVTFEEDSKKEGKVGE